MLRTKVHPISEWQNKKEVSISYHCDSMICNLYINIIHIKPMTKTRFYEDVFSLITLSLDFLNLKV